MNFFYMLIKVDIYFSFSVCLIKVINIVLLNYIHVKNNNYFQCLNKFETYCQFVTHHNLTIEETVSVLRQLESLVSLHSDAYHHHCPDAAKTCTTE